MEMLSGKVAVVTGAASGIGRALAQRFAAEHMRVVLADVESGPLESTANALADTGAEVLAVPTDVTDSEAVESLAAAARDRFGTYHVVCNNAGVIGHFGCTWETPLADWRWVLDTNVFGVIHGIRAFLPRLLAQGEGHVVNTSSSAGWRAPPAMGPYAASKHAVLAISQALRAELEALGSPVGVTALCPGMVRSQIMASERNWPERLGSEPPLPTDQLSLGVRQVLTNGTTAGDVDPPAVADAVVQAILTNCFVVTTHLDQVVEMARDRLALAERAGMATPDG